MTQIATPNERLESARLNRRWSVEVASGKVGVSVNTFNRWERGLQVPQLETLDLLCRAFDMDPDELGFAHAISAKRRKRNRAQGSGGPEPVMRPYQTAPPGAEPEMPSPVIGSFPYQSVNALNQCMSQAQRSLEEMGKQESGEGVSRRHAVALLVSTPAAVFGLAHMTTPSSLHPEEVLTLCNAHIPLCWQLYFEGGSTEVTNALPQYMYQLETIVNNHPKLQKRTASLASQGHQLISLLELQKQNFGTALQAAEKAYQCGKQAEDANLQIASLIRKAQVYLYLRRPYQRLATYQRALLKNEALSPLLRGRAYIGLAEAASNLHHKEEAEQALRAAHQIFPGNSQDDPNFAYTHFDHTSLYTFEGLTYLNLNQPKQAWQSFTKVEKEVPDALVPNRLELTVRQASILLAMRELEGCCDYIEKAVKAAHDADNQLRRDEAYLVYEDMRERWNSSPRVKSLETLFH